MNGFLLLCAIILVVNRFYNSADSNFPSSKSSLGACAISTTCKNKMEPIILVHGGAGEIIDQRVQVKLDGVKKAAKIGYEILRKGGSVLDAVEAAVRCMEDDEAFNCGYGSVLNADGEVEMDASIMFGKDLSTGAVTVVKDIAHPISLARMVMEKTPHVKLAGAGANRFAKEQCVPTVQPGALVTPYAKKSLEYFLKNGGELTPEMPLNVSYPGEVGTVGAVAIDANGRMAAATSTGGMNGKMVGRCSDSSVVGSGTYADDRIGAVSTTGYGEAIAKVCVAHGIIKEMEYGKTAQEATEHVLKNMTLRLNRTAGAITLSRDGKTGIYFTTSRMAWAYQRGNELHCGVEHDSNHTEILE